MNAILGDRALVIRMSVIRTLFVSPSLIEPTCRKLNYLLIFKRTSTREETRKLNIIYKKYCMHDICMYIYTHIYIIVLKVLK
jgi:hypothetical protein